MKYKEMEDWLSEIENFGTRYERFLEEWDNGMDEKRMKQWLQAAWDCARMEES